jgi:predicted phosphohydrolase
MTVLWVTDPHLNLLHPQNGAKAFAQYLAKENPDAHGLIITGDIATGPTLERTLRQLVEGFEKPIYFVLGNHDYWFSSFKDIDRVAGSLEIPNLYWLNKGVCKIGPWAIVGVGGWYDAFYGNPWTRAEMADFSEISELKPGLQNRERLLELVRERAEQEASTLSKLLLEACQGPEKTILVASHVVPYREAYKYNGAPGEEMWAPWFTSKILGSLLDRFSHENPEKTFISLAGHSHGAAVYRRSSNLTVYVGGAEYRAPDLAGILDPWKEL